MDFIIETVFNASVNFEYSVAIGDWTYLVIYGKHINGYFCCIPNWKLGCEMANPCEIAYNKDKLVEAGATEKVAQAISNSIKYMEDKYSKK